MKFKLEEIAKYSNKKIEVDKINCNNYISTENMLPNKLGIVKATALPKQSKVCFYEKDNILISNIRPYFKKIWFANCDGGCSNDVLNIMVSDTKKILPRFLYYFLFQDNFFDYVMAGNKGTKMPRGDKKHIMKYTVNIPSTEKQIKIIDILDSIDKKIEINNKINDNLFKFAINYINNKKEHTEVPVINFAKIQGGYAFKSKELLDKKTKNRIIKIKNLRSELNADVVNSQFAKDEIITNLDSKFKLEKGDVTIAMTGAELGKTGFIYGFDNYYLNQRVGVIRGNNKEKELYLKILFLTDEFQTLINSKGYGSAQPNISTSDIESILINDITAENLRDIYERLNSVYYRIISNCEEILNLEQLRDTLLPKLMNGEIDLDKIKYSQTNCDL